MYATPMSATVTIIAGNPMRRILLRTIRITHTVTITKAMPVEYSYMFPSGQWPASSARVQIEAKCKGQPISTSALPLTPRKRLRTASSRRVPWRGRGCEGREPFAPACPAGGPLSLMHDLCDWLC